MKDKTDAMNGASAEMLAEGYEIVKEKPMSPDERCHRKYSTLFDGNKALEEYENYSEMGWDIPGGFLRRSNPTERI